MKSLRFALLFVLTLLAAPAFAQSDMQKSTAKAAPSAAQQSFTTMKTFAGEWEGPVTLNPPMNGMGNTKLHVSMRVASRGNSIVHELQESGTPFDATKYDHPITMLYVDGDRLYLTHYCDAGNRPRMVGKASPDGKQVEFDFLDLSGGNQHGHMDHAVFTAVDDNHHIEDWTYMMPGDKPMHAHMELKRVQ
jgi:hypothetical protein